MSAEGLRASKIPAHVSLIVDDESGNGLPSSSVSGTYRGKGVALSLEDLSRGHAVADGVWYLVDPGLATEVVSIVKSSGVTLGRARSLKTFLAIRKAASTGAPIEDRMMERPVSPLAFAPPADNAPTGVLALPYPYQSTGWRWLKFLLSEGVGGLLADEMGLGKRCKSSVF
jgi:hypothetical protein